MSPRSAKPLRRILEYLAACLALLAAWKITALCVGSAILPQPEDALLGFGLALIDPAFWKHFFASGYRAGVAMALAWLVGFPLGVLMGGVKRFDAVAAPMVFLTYPVPKIVLLPVVLLLMGLGNASKITMIALILGYQVLVAVRDGVRNIHPKYLDSIRSLGAGNARIFTEALWPAALPHGFTALRLNSGVSVAVLFFVESFATTQGLGYLIMDAWGRLAYVDMFTGILGMSLLGVLLYETVNMLEHLTCRWKR